MLRSTIRRIVPIAVALSVVSAAACTTRGESEGGGGADDELVFAAVPSENSKDFIAGYQPLVDQLSKALGRPIKLQTATTTAGVIEAQIAKRVDIAVYGAFGYYLAKERGADIEPVAAVTPDPSSEQPGYRAYAVARKNSTITNLRQAKGHDVCFVDPGSSSGYLFPVAGLHQSGLDPKKDFKTVFAGGHDATVLSVMSGDCDLGFAFDQMVDKIMPAKHKIGPDKIKVVWKSELIPQVPIALGSWLPDDVKQTVVDTLTSQNAVDMASAGLCKGHEYTAPDTYGDVAGKPACVIGLQEMYSWIPVDDAFYDPVREVCRLTKAESCVTGTE